MILKLIIKLDNTFNTCINEDIDVFEERSFELLGINSETGAGIGGGGIESNFEIYDNNRLPLFEKKDSVMILKLRRNLHQKMHVKI